ncbi:hypothetical protein Tco_1421004 [Tanacetum coccineum]
MESSNSNSKERELQLTQRLSKQRHSICMTWFEQLETHLHDLYLLNSPYAVDAFKPAFCSFFGDEHQTFKLKMFHNLDQLRLQLERENLHGVNAKTCLQALRTQFKEFLASKGVNATDLLNQGWQQDFEDFTRCEPSAYRRELLENLDTLEAVIHRAVITYGRLQLQSQDAQINPVQAVDDSLNVSKSSWIESENHNALSKSMNETQLQQHESLVTESTTLEANLNTDVKALDDGSVITESSETKSDMHDTSSSSRTYITHVVDANIRPVNDQVPSAEVHLTAPHNVLANEQKHTDQSEPRYDTYLLEKSVENADLKAQIQEKVFANAALNNELRKLKGNIVDSKFAKASILGKPPLQPSRNHLVVRQPNAFTSERPRISRQRFASQVDEKNDLYLPNVRESAPAKPHHVNAPSSSRNSHKESDSNVEYLRANLNIKGMSNSRRTSLSNVDYMLYPSLLRTVTDWKGKPSLRSTERSLLHDNIVPKPDLALELGKSISLTEAEEEAVAREVHATHARIVSGPDPEPMQEDQTGSNSGKLHVSLAGPNPEHMDDEFLATAYPKVHENLKLITDERVIEENPESHSGSMSSMKNLDDTYNFGDQFLYDKPTEDDQEKSKVIEESDSTIPDPSHQTVTSTPPVIAPFTDVSSTKPSSLVTPPPINTEATTITTSLPEITPFIALQLRVARLEQEMSEVKKTDHSADVLASIKSQVPTVVDKYLGTKLDDALLKILERHTADLIEKYSALPGPESIKNQESEKSPKEIIRIKREQGEEKQDSTYSIRSTDKVALEEFDLKSALFKHMNKNKTANRNPANYHLYHALMEALIADEDAMDKEVAVKVKDHKRKHDSDDEEDDDDDEGPSAGSNQGRSAKRRRPESAASGSAQPPSKNDHQSSKKPRESDASASIQHPALTSTGWQITDTRDDVVNSLMHMLPNNIQITDTNSFIVSKKRSPAEQEAADIMKALKESKKMSKRQPGTGGSNEGTGNILGVPDESTVISRASSEGTGSKPGVPDEEKANSLVGSRYVKDEPGKTTMETEVESMVTVPIQQVSSSVPLLILQSSISHLLNHSGPAPSVMTPGYISSGLVQISVSPTPYVPPSKKDYEILAVDPVGSPSSTTNDRDEQSTSTSPTNQEIQSQVTHQGPVPQFMAPDHSSSGPVLHEMMSDHNSSVLAPQRQEMSVENVSSGLVPQGQKVSFIHTLKTLHKKVQYENKNT